MIRITETNRSTRVAVLATSVAIALAALALAGCASKAAPPSTAPVNSTPAASAFPVTLTDDAGRKVTIKSVPARIVSLAPANTEIAFALGLGDKVVGVTSYDDYPSQVATIAKVGDFTGPNVEAVAAAKPDLILATSGVQADAVKKLEDLGATVLVLDPQSLNGVYNDIERVGRATATSAKANDVVAGMQGVVEKVVESVVGSPTVSAFIEIGQNPLFTAGKGTLMDQLLTVAGGTNVVTQSGYVSYSAEQVIKADPQVYFATKGSSSDPAAIEKRPGFSGLSAVKNKRVVILDDSLVSRGGPRIVDGLKQILVGLYPGATLP